ncbi:MAG TPA: Sua5/YciO/YrdC/YwlC family protein, partial [Anaerolineales bacterium]
HYLLFDGDCPNALIMTSGNYSEEPIATDNADALKRLAPLADAFLLHDRDIHIRTDDSVVRVFEGSELPIRRSRGYAPYPIKLPFDVPPILAMGGELKNTFCITRDRYAFLSHHIGDLENLETLRSFEQGVAHFERLFRIAPGVLAHDLHPDYLATRYAQERANRQGQMLVGIQHHHAHIAACLAENGHTGAEKVIGVAFDGTGFGTDGTIWGGEFLVADYAGFERAAHLACLPLPGGDAGTRKPARVALAQLLSAGVTPEGLPPFAALSEVERRIVKKQLASGLNSPLTSSLGRLFDAIASIVGLRQEINYEGQAAIELEAIADPLESGRYEFELRSPRPEAGGWSIETGSVIRAVVGDVRTGTSAAVISARFHNGLAAMVREVCAQLRRARGLNQVALSGGVFQNITLLGKTGALLRADGFEVLTHRLVPPNDGGIALGQALIAAQVLSTGKFDGTQGPSAA